MTLNELKQKIAESPNKDWYQNYEIKIHYPHISYETTLKGVINIYDFVSKQADGFSNYSNLPMELNEIKNSFIDAKGGILRLISENNIYQNSWSDAVRFISGNSYRKMLLYDLPEVTFLVKIFSEKPKSFEAAYEYITAGNLNDTSNKDYFEGYLLAYEFLSKDFSVITERKESEKKTILKIRSDFEKSLGKAEAETVEYIDKINQKYQAYASQIDVLSTEKKMIFEDWFNRTTDQFFEFNKISLEKVNELEELYKSKLKLEAPAQYWKQRADTLRKEGRNWLNCLIGSVAIGVILLIIVLILISTGDLQKIFEKTATAIKWSVVFITLVSFIAFAIRIFSKLTFSSFHLVRDAEEREQLTYVYLALQKEKGIDQTERQLIMQSIFSRADSGLLKDEAAPTMPGNILNQITSR